MSSSHRNRNLPRTRDHLGNLLNFLIDGHHSVTVSLYTFIIVSGSGVDQVLYVAEIKMTKKEYLTSIQKIVALNVEETLQKRNPQCVRATYAQVAFRAQVFRNSEQNVLRVGRL